MARATDYREQVLKEMEGLSEERIKAVADFAAYLREREEWEETTEITEDDDLMRKIGKSRKAWSEEKKEEFVSLEEIRTRLHV